MDAGLWIVPAACGGAATRRRPYRHGLACLSFGIG